MNNFFYSRYKTLILSFIVFLCLMMALLGLNYYAMYQVSSNSSIVDGIGELSDELYNLNLHTQKLKIADTDEERKKAMNAVITSRRIAGKYVELFEKGGDYHYDNGEKIFIPKLEDEVDVENYRQLKAWWVDYEKKLDMVSAGEDVEPVADHIYDSKDFLYTLVNNIWTNQFDKVDYWNKYAKKALFAGVFLALLYLCWFIFYFLKKLNHSDENLKTARCQTTRILGTVQDGLFLIDKNFIISEVHSKNLEKILQRNNIAGQNLVELLQEMIGKDNIEEVKLFIEQLYNPWVVPELIEDLNPLKKIRVGFLSEEGEPIVKYLSFTFIKSARL